jgi:hypothetical protein
MADPAYPSAKVVRSVARVLAQKWSAPTKH